MPKKILVIINGFDIGGTIVSLYSLLSVIDTNKIKLIEVLPKEEENGKQR